MLTYSVVTVIFRYDVSAKDVDLCILMQFIEVIEQEHCVLLRTLFELKWRSVGKGKRLGADTAGS